MESVRKRIVYDEQQRPVQVLISYEDWLRIEPMLQKAFAPNVGVIEALRGKVRFEGDPVAVQREVRSDA